MPSQSNLPRCLFLTVLRVARNKLHMFQSCKCCFQASSNSIQAQVRMLLQKFPTRDVAFHQRIWSFVSLFVFKLQRKKEAAQTNQGNPLGVHKSLNLHSIFATKTRIPGNNGSKVLVLEIMGDNQHWLFVLCVPSRSRADRSGSEEITVYTQLSGLRNIMKTNGRGAISSELQHTPVFEGELRRPVECLMLRSAFRVRNYAQKLMSFFQLGTK